MRFESFNAREHYYLTSRGPTGKKLFLDDSDRARFILLITHFQSPAQIYNVDWYAGSLLKHGSLLKLSPARTSILLKKRGVELLQFNLQDESFHLIVKNLEESMISVYMHRVLTGYGKYFNAKYGRQGQVFPAPFKARHLKGKNELLTASASLHLLPIGAGSYWSSYQDYVGQNRWGNLLVTEQILRHFDTPAEYQKFVEKQRGRRG